MSDELVVVPEVTPTQDYWFCTPPTTEEVRAHIDGTGRIIGHTYRCPHGSWNDLRAARDAHGRAIDVDVV